jgi:hypothetical protein
MKTAGQALVEELSKQLGPHMQWTEAEQVTLSSIEAAADRWHSSAPVSTSRPPIRSRRRRGWPR